MSDIKLFRTTDGEVCELEGTSVAVEKSLQTLIERHCEAFLGVRYVKTEHSTGPVHGGRIDTLGLDENGCPCIIEYKRASNENVINQGLFYLDWLMDHQGDFHKLVLEGLGREAADSIDWLAPRLICIAGDFTKYDQHAVKQINRNIDLVRYRRYGEGLLLFELVHSTVAENARSASPATASSVGTEYTIAGHLEGAPESLVDLFGELEAFLLSLGDDVVERPRKNYVAFRRLRNFACVETHTRDSYLQLHLNADPDEIELEEGFTRDVSSVGHWGTGDLEVTLRSSADLERAKPLLLRAYERS